MPRFNKVGKLKLKRLRYRSSAALLLSCMHVQYRVWAHPIEGLGFSYPWGVVLFLAANIPGIAFPVLYCTW
jgi:hypothetical protein